MSEATISATLKGDGKDAAWIVFHGTPEQVEANLDRVLSGRLMEKVVEAESLFKASRTAVAKLGGAFVKEDAKPSEDEHLMGLIAAASSTAELMDIWTRYQDKFKEGTPLFDAMGKRSAELG